MSERSPRDGYVRPRGPCRGSQNRFRLARADPSDGDDLTPASARLSRSSVPSPPVDPITPPRPGGGGTHPSRCSHVSSREIEKSRVSLRRCQVRPGPVEISSRVTFMFQSVWKPGHPTSVIVPPLDVRLHISRAASSRTSWPSLRSSLPQCRRPGFNADEAGRQLCGELQNLPSRQPPPNDNLTSRINPLHLEDRFGDVHLPQRRERLLRPAGHRGPPEFEKREALA